MPRGESPVIDDADLFGSHRPAPGATRLHHQRTVDGRDAARAVVGGGSDGLRPRNLARRARLSGVDALGNKVGGERGSAKAGDALEALYVCLVCLCYTSKSGERGDLKTRAMD